MDATVLASIFFKEFTKKSAAKILDYFTEKFKKEGDSNYSNCKKALESHLSEVIKWCSRIDFIGLEKPKSIENDTIPLIISSSIRTYGNIQGKDISELELLNSNENYVVLGDPGSGKSTTLKRIARDFFWGKIEYSFEYIILVRLKDIEQGGLLTFIANTLGIVWHNVKKEVGPEKFVYEQYVGTEILENAIPQFLKKINALLILDGFDELNSDVSSVIKSDIKILSRKSIGYKILLTSRYGENFNGFENFSFCELEKLNTEQINLISKFWAIDAGNFIIELNKRTYYEYATRPLFLNFLILHYNKLGYLPDNSNEVTKQIIYLLLRDWNEYHEVKRVSSYSNFYIEKKVDFLINFAYFINYRETQNNKRFSHNDLLFAYKSICEKFELPLEDAEKVINEIESHTGIIIKLFGNLFEFSHLVLQEYLCGEYLVKQPLSQELAKNFIQDPNPIAIAVTLSSERSLFFSNLFLNQNVSPAIWSNPSSVIKFLTRLNLENPRFEQRFMLGIAVMSLYFEMKKFDEVLELLNKLSSRKEILNSIKEAMDYYTLEKAPIVASKNLLLFTRNTKGKIAYYNLYLPYQVALNGDLYNSIIN